MATQDRRPWSDPEIALFRKTVRDFVTKEFLPHQARWQSQRHPDAQAWTAAGKVGLLLPDVPDQYGGGGGTFAHQCVVIEELARSGVNFGAAVQGIVARYILAYGSEAQKRDWLPRMARGELVGAIAMTEPHAGSDLQGIRTTARREGDDYVIDGSKTFITNGLHAGIVCVAAKTDAKAPGARGISMIMAETQGLSGYRTGRPLEKLGMHAQDTCELFFGDVRVPASNLLGSSEGMGFSQMMEQLPYERLGVAVGAGAMMEQALNLTVRYAKERTAFGQQLLEFQNTRFRLAECTTEARIGRVFVDDCIRRFMAGENVDIAAAMAKYWMTETLGRVVDSCVQVHGGYGYMTEYPIARMWADSRVQRIFAGSNEIMKEVIGWSL